MAWEYSEKTKKIFMDAVHGKRGTHLGEIEDPDGFGEHGSIACGDALRFTFKVKKNKTDPTKDVIVKAKYLTFGCTSAIAASEALCAIIEKGKYTPVTALQVKNKDIVDYLEGLPEQKIHCSVMGAEALEAAVFNWAQKRKVDLAALGIHIRPNDQQEGRIVCKCFSLSEPYIKRKIKELGLKTIKDITNAIKAGGACMSCHHAPGGLQDLLNEAAGEAYDETKEAKEKSAGKAPEKAPEPAEAPKQNGLSPYQLGKKVEAVIAEEIAPMLEKDGGGVELVDIKDRTVYCRLVGACKGCAGAHQTMKSLVERTLRAKVDDTVRVIQV